MRWKPRFALFASMTLLIIWGCRWGPPGYVHPNADLSYITKVAVMPFNNLTTDQYAGRKVREVLIAELLLTGVLEVVEPGEVNRVLAKEQVESVATLTAEQVKRIGKALGAQALILGTVEEFGESRSGSLSAPLVTIGLRMLDVESGIILWSVNHSKGGVGTKMRLFGISEGNISEVTTQVVRESIDTLFQ
jgi:TolB-like protein